MNEDTITRSVFFYFNAFFFQEFGILTILSHSSLEFHNFITFTQQYLGFIGEGKGPCGCLAHFVTERKKKNEMKVALIFRKPKWHDLPGTLEYRISQVDFGQGSFGSHKVKREMEILDGEVLCAFYMISIRTEQKYFAINLLKSFSQRNFSNFSNLLNTVKKCNPHLMVKRCEKIEGLDFL